MYYRDYRIYSEHPKQVVIGHGRWNDGSFFGGPADATNGGAGGGGGSGGVGTSGSGGSGRVIIRYPA